MEGAELLSLIAVREADSFREEDRQGTSSSKHKINCLSL